jgi:Zn-dependent M28 family amino/carboxypeptidase
MMAEPNLEESNRPDELKAALIQHLQEVVRERDPFWARAGHFYVQHYVRQQWSQWGEVTTHEFEHQGQSYQNLILDLPAAQPAANRPPILVGAHYDAVLKSPGADDNATGLAVLLELARWFVQHPARFPIRLVAFDLEEYGLVGSRAYAAELRQQNQVLRLMLSLEMLGYCDATPNSQRYPPGLQYFYPNCGNFIGLIGNWQTIPDLMRLSRQINRTGVPCQWLPAGSRGQMVPDTRRSDHAPFWDQGYRALMVTDTANLRNPHYHRSSDRIETLDLNFLTGVCRGIIAALKSL